MKKLTILVIGVVLLTLSCQKEDITLTGERGGTLVIGTIVEPSNLSPLYPSVAGFNELTDLLFLHLHRTDPTTGKMIPELAESWEYSEDLQSITYNLRQDVKWWDGKNVTAEDVVYTFDLMKNPKTGYTNLAKLRFIEKVEQVGAYRVRFYFKKVYADELTDSDLQPLPKHILSKVKNVNEASFHWKPVGNGPFKLKLWSSGAFLELVANDDFYRGKPPLDKIVVRFYQDIDSLTADVNKGIIDIVPDLNPTIAASFKGSKNVKVSSNPGNSYLYIGWNLKNELLKDKKIREALTMAIDRKGILRDIYLKEGAVSTGPIPPSSWGFNKDIKPISYKPDKTREILAKEGWRDLDYDRILEKGRAVNEFRLTIITNRENPDRVQILNKVAADLRSVGIRVNKEVVDINTFIRRIIARDFDGMIMGWSVSDKIDPTIYWHSEASRGIYNFVGYKNKKVDSLIEAGLLSINIDDAIRIWHEFQDIVYGEQPYTFLVVPNEINAYHTRIQNLNTEFGPSIETSFAYWLKKKDQRIVKVPGAEEIVTPEEKPEEKKPEEKKPEEKKPVAEEKKPEKPPEIVTPEKILEEEAAKIETTTTTTTAPAETAAAKESKPFKKAVYTRPKIKNFVPAKYPSQLIDLGLEGTVVVKVLVGTNGTVKDTKIIQSFGNDQCERAAIAAAKKATFTPATKDGEAVETWMSLPFKFKPPR